MSTTARYTLTDERPTEDLEDHIIHFSGIS